MPTTSPPQNKRRTRVKLGLKLHSGQREVYESDARFRVVACGRQWGKSRLGSVIAFETALKGGQVWWIAPTADIAKIGWDLLKGLARQLPTVKINETTRVISFGGRGWVQVKGAHLPGKLRGRTLDLVIMDEAAFIPTAARWNSELRPTLSIKQGKGLFLSTFDGENWFYDLYQQGQDAAVEDWESWRFVSTENPYFTQEELEVARATTPPAEFEQEYMANPLVYVGAVFKGEDVQRAWERGQLDTWRDDISTYAGLDWGHNTTAFEVCQEDAEDRVHWLQERIWHAVELNERCAEITEICRERNVEVVYADAAGASEIVTLDGYLRRAGLNTMIQPIPFNKYKDDGIMTRQYYLERGLEAIGPGCPKLLKDSKRYHYKEGTDLVVKEEDHTVDSATAFYAWRRDVLIGMRNN